MNRIELVSSSARVTSAKFHKVLDVCTDIERPGPIDRTPETPGSGKKKKVHTFGNFRLIIRKFGKSSEIQNRISGKNQKKKFTPLIIWKKLSFAELSQLSLSPLWRAKTW